MIAVGMTVTLLVVGHEVPVFSGEEWASLPRRGIAGVDLPGVCW